MSVTPLGQVAFGTNDLGNGEDNTSTAPGAKQYYGSHGLLVTYNLMPKGTLGNLKITYSITQHSSISLPVFYLIGARYPAYSINNDYTIPAPESMNYISPAQVGLDLNLGVLVQGYASVVWSWQSLSYAEAQKLLSFYDPTMPAVMITYPSDLGFWVARQAMMQPPQIGQRSAGESYHGLTLTFSHIIPS